MNEWDAEGVFIWDLEKERLNIVKHGVSFRTAMLAFLDPGRKIYFDRMHSGEEARFFCYGKVEGRVLTVRFTYRDGRIRIIGVGYWRKGDRFYEKN
jgi:uncharacterized DUF497 family protein